MMTAEEHKSNVDRMQISHQVVWMHFDQDTMVLKCLDELRKVDDIALATTNGGF